eukprot:UN10754
MEENDNTTMTTNVPLEMMRTEDWALDGYEPPQMPEPDVSIRAPKLRLLRSSLVRMSSVTNKLSVTLSNHSSEAR